MSDADTVTTAPDTVTAAELRAALAATPGRPALDRDALRRARTAPHLAALLDGLRAEAARGLAEPLPPPPWSLYRRYQQTGDRLGYERAYFARRGRLNALALAVLVDEAEPTAGVADAPTDAPTDALADALWSVCDEYTWALPAHAHLLTGERSMARCVDLFAAETAHTLAEIVTLLGDRLPGPVADRVRAEVHRRVLDPYFGDPRPWPWESLRNNWAAVCAGAAGMAALALLPGTSPTQQARLAAALRRCLAAMAAFQHSFGADGGCAEGVSYWVYGFGYYCYFAEALRERTGLDLLGRTPAVQAAFPANVELFPGRFVTFSDADESPMLPSGLLSRLHARLGAPRPARLVVPGPADDHCHRWAHLSRTLIWTDPDALGERAHPPSEGCWLGELAWLVDRRVSAGGVPVAFAARGGHNDEPHNHLDLGHFILAAGGEQLLVDLGAGEYTADYFGPQRYGCLHPSAAGHSVPVVDGRDQRPGRDAAAVVLGVDRRDDGADLALDLSPAYGRQLRRRFQWRAGPAGSAPALRITDEFPGATDVDELLISRRPPVLAGGTASWHGRAATAVLRYDPAGWSPSVERIDTRDHHGAATVVYRLRLHSLTPPEAATLDLALHQ